jgi:hypothetical protein
MENETIRHQLAIMQSAADCLEIEPHRGGVSSQGQLCLAMGQKSANRLSAYCLARWGWSPSQITFDAALPKLRKGAWIATDIPTHSRHA